MIELAPSGYHLECDFEHNYKWVPDDINNYFDNNPDNYNCYKISEEDNRSSLEKSIENGKELIEFFKNKREYLDIF